MRAFVDVDRHAAFGAWADRFRERLEGLVTGAPGRLKLPKVQLTWALAGAAESRLAAPGATSERWVFLIAFILLVLRFLVENDGL